MRKLKRNLGNIYKEKNMGKLKDDLPKITKKVLDGEDKITKGLALSLLREVMVNHNNGDFYPIVRKVLDDEIEKSITSGLIDSDNLEEN